MAEQPTNAAVKPPVCVTGANGFIGSWIVKTLLDHGYTTIHLSIFPGSDPSHLFSLPGATSSSVSLIVHHVNLLDAAAVDKAVEGCAGGGVFHLASPCTLEDAVDPERELVEPAVKGTLNVLAAAKKFGVRRVVLTSSISAMVPNPGWPAETVVDESSWTDLDYCTSRQTGTKDERTWSIRDRRELRTYRGPDCDEDEDDRGEDWLLCEPAAGGPTDISVIPDFGGHITLDVWHGR